MELWFKEMIHELSTVIHLFEQEKIQGQDMGMATGRLNRINEILQVLIQQIRVMETMTPLDFLDFRSYLFPASGFQSFQFRQLEVMLGLKTPRRLTYANEPYYQVFPQEQQDLLKDWENRMSLRELVEQWLGRTPFLEMGAFHFVEEYKKAVQRMLEKEQAAIHSTTLLSEQEKQQRLKMLGDTNSYFALIFDPKVHQQLHQEGNVQLSYRAILGALLVHLYRDEPLLQMPFQLLSQLTELDESLTLWRYRHAQMVLRMLGRKVGTGGSSGHDYLHATAAQHQIFGDLHQISTLLIPRSELPTLPAEVRRQLGFYFSG